jgi:hypothetical protein
MIELIELRIDDLKDHILKDFDGVTELPIKEDYKITKEFEPLFYTWIEKGKILGYMGIYEDEEIIFCSYTKRYDKKIHRKMYNFLKGLKVLNKPIITDGTNWNHCKNHVIPYKDTGLFEWVI